VTTQDTVDRHEYGVHSEVGRLRKVLVCAPGLAHRRLTPTNSDDLLFDDVMWVENAQRDHADFVNKLRERGVDVVELHELLAQTMTIPAAKDWLLDRKIVANEVGLGIVDATRAYLESLEPAELAKYLIGGLATTDLPDDYRTDYVALVRESTGVREYLMPPLPNTLYTRDTTCWLYGGLTLNPLYWPARHDETLLMKAIYTFHPDFAGSVVWWGDPELDWGQATFEGGDIMPVGNGVVLMGMSERTSRQAITQVAKALFDLGAAEHVVVAGMPKLRSAMHLDTVFTFADRDLVTLYPTIMDAVHTFSLRPGDKAPGIDIVDEGRPRSPTSSPRRSACPNCGSWRRAATSTPPSASSGTAATTRSRWSRAWSSPTTATPRPTPCCARPASRSSRSSAPSWDAAGVAGTA
jgi:arginine deiminase